MGISCGNAQDEPLVPRQTLLRGGPGDVDATLVSAAHRLEAAATRSIMSERDWPSEGRPQGIVEE